MFVTGTSAYGRVFTEFDSQGHPLNVKDHRQVFQLSFRRDRKNDFETFLAAIQMVDALGLRQSPLHVSK